MSRSDAPNPERKSNNAMLCFCIGVGLIGLAYFLGVGAVIGAATGGVGGLIMAGSTAIALMLALIGGFVLTLIGGIWMIVRVIADQTGDKDEERYRNVER